MKRLYISMSVIFLVSLFYTPLSFGAVKVLLVGVQNYKNLPTVIKGQKLINLKGPVNDVNKMKSALVSYYGISEDDIKVLIDEQATKKNVEDTFKDWLIKGTKKGDFAVFFFSGHGSWVEDVNGDERDGRDEVLLPYDMSPVGGYNIIVDDELGRWLKELNGRTVVVMIDSCYSGGVSRSIGGAEVSRLEETPARQSKYIPINDYQPSLEMKAIPKGPDLPDSVIFMAASGEGEVALEVAQPEGFQGGFTYGLYEGMKNLRNVSYERLFELAKNVVIDKLRLPQHPQIEAKKDLVAEIAFKNPNASSGELHIEPQTPPWVKGEKVLLRIEQFEGADDSIMSALKHKLGNLDYVEIVEEGFFDRLIRGKMDNGRYIVRLLNGIGDVDSVEPAGKLDNLMNSIVPKLEYAYMVKQLAHLSHPNPPFNVKLWSFENRRDFRIGEKVVFNIKSEKECYLLMVNLDSEGNVHIIFPNKFYEDNKITGGRTISLPDEQMRKKHFEFEFGQPVGEETVKVIATLEPLRLEDLGIEDLKRLFDSGGKVERDKRTIFVKQVTENISSGNFIWSEDTIVIRSHR